MPDDARASAEYIELWWAGLKALPQPTVAGERRGGYRL